ncbi:MAG: hypothetical protein E7508_07175 [Ruminococcus sp.]|nr:hypothetical protein [Ruminococcus sp.]
MKKAKKVLLVLMSAILMIECCGCGIIDFGIGDTETSRTVIYKEREEIEEDVKTYLSNKYGKEFTVAVTDSPNHIYSSYEVTAYDEEMNSFDVSITYYDEENYSVTESYLLYGMKDDFESWFTELADPYIDSEFKVFFIPMDDLPYEYHECATVEEFLETSKTSTYYGLRFYIVLPSDAYDEDIAILNNSIAFELLNQHIRGQITMIAYQNKDVFEQINTKKDERYFWIHSYKNANCTSTIQMDFNLVEAETRYTD